jgi:hypothetical protein
MPDEVSGSPADAKCGDRSGRERGLADTGSEAIKNSHTRIDLGARLVER